MYVRITEAAAPVIYINISNFVEIIIIYRSFALNILQMQHFQFKTYIIGVVLKEMIFQWKTNFFKINLIYLRR